MPSDRMSSIDLNGDLYCGLRLGILFIDVLETAFDL